MITLNKNDCENKRIESLNYKGETLPVKGVSVRWLSETGKGKDGQPEYGLRFFTVDPGGEIPKHNHFYIQTMYIVSGQFECFEFDPETDEITDRKIVGPGDAVYVPSMELHGMVNLSATEEGTFLCCICNLYPGA